MRVRLVGVVALMALVVASCGGGVPEAAGPSEGIQVHGDWTIDVYNEDGTLDQHVEFSNAFTTRGRLQLVNWLTGSFTVGEWGVTFGESANASVCPTTLLGKCDAPASATGIDTNGSGFADTLRLSASTAVEADGQIEQVSTIAGNCPSSIAPDDCPVSGSTTNEFTRKTLDAADVVAVSAGQTVQVEVEISFTSG